MFASEYGLNYFQVGDLPLPVFYMYIEGLERMVEDFKQAARDS